MENIAKTGGHLASDLGVIELTMALHLSFDLTRDRIIWDVGHQSYTHKILTGRKLGFATLRQYGGMSGFPKTQEDPADAFNTGHSSTSISAGLGMAQARELTGDNYYVVSVIGDGALTGGMAYEAMNNASRMKTNFIIVLNDNQMSISENVGGMNQYLNSFRTSDAYLDLKDSVTNSLNRIPVVGERMVKRIRTPKAVSNSCLFRECFLKIWESPIYTGGWHQHKRNPKSACGSKACARSGAGSCTHDQGRGISSCRASSGALPWNGTV